MKNVYYDYETRNKSFLNIREELKCMGIENNNFMLTLMDKSLQGVDPFSNSLGEFTKHKIIRECCNNYWYFLRECAMFINWKSGDAQYFSLDIDSVKLHYCMSMNYDIIADSKYAYDVSCRLLWEFLFGTTRSNISLIDKTHKLSKKSLDLIRKIYNKLPSYLKMELLKDNQDTLENGVSYNKIRAIVSAKSASTATHIGRGLTQPILWYQNFQDIPFIDILFDNAAPAVAESKSIAKKNHSLCSTIITGNLAKDHKLISNTRSYDYFMRMISSAAYFDVDKFDLSKDDILRYIRDYSSTHFLVII